MSNQGSEWNNTGWNTGTWAPSLPNSPIPPTPPPPDYTEYYRQYLDDPNE